MISNSSDSRAIFARCVINTAEELGTPNRDRFYADDLKFDLLVEKVYPILGIGMFETVVLALVLDETQKPNWHPIGLFEIESASIPGDWLITVLDGLAASGGDASNRWVFKAGYARLVEEPGHSDGLIEREEDHMRFFYSEYQHRAGRATEPEIDA